MDKLVWVVFALLISGLIFGLLATDNVADYWMGYIKDHAKEHDYKKNDFWEWDQKVKVARYCQTLGNCPRAMVIYKDIIDNSDKTQADAQIADYWMALCYERANKFM